ncbi:hypothetical protein E2I00_014193 [Balaenoptera physalus]|uniref:Cyclic nucleotide-binding domain-containing protein n=1 Tax=Balaenoptera physalus TaxID=9770 RepID=A0A6A1QAU9_BALPH|nr:hypothetical protein E2I00_014193 [Balaenoptera physalus]
MKRPQVEVEFICKVVSFQLDEPAFRDLEIVYSYLHGMEALSNLREHQLRLMCETVRYERHEANEVLYYVDKFDAVTASPDDIGTCWYILLSGSVFIKESMFLPRSSSTSYGMVVALVVVVNRSRSCSGTKMMRTVAKALTDKGCGKRQKPPAPFTPVQLRTAARRVGGSPKQEIGRQEECGLRAQAAAAWTQPEKTRGPWGGLEAADTQLLYREEALLPLLQRYRSQRSFGKRSAGSFRRGCECIVLEPSEMIVVDYMDENEEYFQRQASHRQSRRRFRKINQKGERQTIIDTVDPYPVGKPPLPRGYHTYEKLPFCIGLVLNGFGVVV